MDTVDLISQLVKIIEVHPKAKTATVHVAEVGRDEGTLHAIRYKAKPNIVILEGDPKGEHTKRSGTW
jgi:hypothetical protein